MDKTVLKDGEIVTMKGRKISTEEAQAQRDINRMSEIRDELAVLDIKLSRGLEDYFVQQEAQDINFEWPIFAKLNHINKNKLRDELKQLGGE